MTGDQTTHRVRLGFRHNAVGLSAISKKDEIKGLAVTFHVCSCEKRLLEEENRRNNQNPTFLRWWVVTVETDIAPRALQ